MEHLTKRDEHFCETAGMFGLLLTACCLIQHLYFMLPHWISFSIIAVYIITIVGFTLLMRKSGAAFVVLLISAALVFLVEVTMIITLTFSLILIFLLLYVIIAVALGYASGVPANLRAQSVAKAADEAEWRGKI